MTTATPFMSSTMEVLPEWIDNNGHLNMAYYNVLFDLATNQAFELMGIGPDYVTERKLTTYTAEFHVRYLRELHEGDKVRVAFQLLDADEKRFRFCQWLYHEDGWLSATGEGLSLHIDMSGPRVAPFPEDVAQKVMALKEAHAGLPVPDFVGKPIGIRRKSG